MSARGMRTPSSSSSGGTPRAAAELSEPLAAVHRAVDALVAEAQRASLQRLDAERAEAARIRVENAWLAKKLGQLRDAGSEISLLNTLPEPEAAEAAAADSEASEGADAGRDRASCRSPRSFTPTPEGLAQPCSRRAWLVDRPRGERREPWSRGARGGGLEEAPEPPKGSPEPLPLGRPTTVEGDFSDRPDLPRSFSIPRQSTSLPGSALRSTAFAAARGHDDSLVGSHASRASAMTQRVRRSSMIAATQPVALEHSSFFGPKRRVFTDVDHMKDRVRAHMMKPDYNFAKLYRKTGICQAISTHRWFDAVSLFVVILNAIWIGVDTDHNSEPVLVDAELHFQVMEHLFCIYFQFDWWVRFLAFDDKCRGLKDSTFALDTALLVVMTFEAWVMSIIVVIMRSSSSYSGSPSSETDMLRNTSILQGLRLLRLVKMVRIVRVFRTFPEIMVLIRAMVASVRTVCITLVFLFIADYVFAVAIMQMSRGTHMKQQYFDSLTTSMHTLLIVGAFPDQEVLLRKSAEEHWVYWLVLFIFILFSTITIMNMMVGVLVEVVKTTQAIEKESLDVRLLRDHLLAAVHSLHGADVSDPSEVNLSKDDLWELVEHPAAIRVLQNTGVDVLGLVDLVDHIFRDETHLPFTSIMDTVLQLRSSNIATVKDLVELRKYLTRELSGLRRHVSDVLALKT